MFDIYGLKGTGFRVATPAAPKRANPLQRRVDDLSKMVKALALARVVPARERDAQSRRERDAQARREEAKAAAEASRARFKIVPLGLQVDGKIVVPPDVLCEALDYEPLNTDLISDERDRPEGFAYETEKGIVSVAVAKDGITLTSAKGSFSIPYSVVLHAWNASPGDQDIYCDTREEATAKGLHYCRIVRS